MAQSSYAPLKGLFKPAPLKHMSYGPSAVSDNLLSLLPTPESKAFIITGNSLATKTPLIKNLESLLGKHHAKTFATIRQHCPIADLDEPTQRIASDPSIDTIISVGGGSPIDASKALSYRSHEQNGKYLLQIAIPTTLSAAECTCMAGVTNEDGVKTSMAAAGIAISAILYDPEYAAYTPKHLFISTGLRALDHACELLYYPTATAVPCHAMALNAAHELFEALPIARDTFPADRDVITRCLLAAYSSLGYLGLNVKGGLGMSHVLGYALGSPYGIPHGETSCLTLGKVVALKGRLNKPAASSLARVLDVIPDGKRTGDDQKDAVEVGRRIEKLVRDLNLKTSLNEKGVPKSEEDIIMERATGGAGGRGAVTDQKLVSGVREIVKGLWDNEGNI